MWQCLNQGLDLGLAGQLLSAQEQALRSEANALHTEVLDRQREALVSEARDRLAFVEQQAAEELTQKNLQLNEQAARAMSVQVSSYPSPVSGSTHQGIDCRTSPGEVKCRSIEPDFSADKF